MDPTPMQWDRKTWPKIDPHKKPEDMDQEQQPSLSTLEKQVPPPQQRQQQPQQQLTQLQDLTASPLVKRYLEKVEITTSPFLELCSLTDDGQEQEDHAGAGVDVGSLDVGDVGHLGGEVGHDLRKQEHTGGGKKCQKTNFI